MSLFRNASILLALFLLATLFGGAKVAAQTAGAPAQAPDTASLQQQIDQLKQQLGGLDELKARLAQLEEQLKATQSAQKKTEEARAKEAREHKLSGYIVARFQDDRSTQGAKGFGGAGPLDQFLIRNARLTLSGGLSPKTSYALEIQADSKVTGSLSGSKAQLRTAYIMQQLTDASRLQFGQFVIPWGYELEFPTPDLWTGERALFMDRLFPDQRDLGLNFQWAKDKQSPAVNLALFNGTGINAQDNNDHRNPMIRVKVPFVIGNYDSGSFAVSYYNGESGLGSATTKQNRLGAGAEANMGPVSLLGEYVTGKDLGADINGWYAQLGLKVAKSPSRAFVKYDTYDENTALPDNKFKRWDYGYFYDLDPRNRLTLVFENRKVGSAFSERTKWDGNAWYLQWRVKY